ncbi:aminotransferase class I/II-fold pyridoxal phosphate-dependent enzyme [Ruania halotolerans]|uniref:aminotransferase class I/II-fold pyridoxal phosphate-dependent enzyme n=1 Tax=Ruania halotolerans TaxID=2897773 RepID=UPI001E2A622F|nr:aminotransferase class I/II-fold pyridoxal phosphate-dependent enzyme [Ruania halotolerans]UFU06009.1 aminotransferase class I/II-fold pyridoxal phosphate-dependent enzyme [Ruania halotolerans]
MRAARRAAVPPFEVMSILDRVAQLRAAGRDVISLCAGEPDGGAPSDVAERAVALHQANDLGYTSALGPRPLREEIAGHYRRWYGLDLTGDDVAITTGSSGAFVLTFLAAFDPGDRVALASPGYPAYRNILTALGCEVVDIPCGPEHRFQPTPDLLDEVAARRGPLRGLVVASPANPTGTMLTRAELASLTAWCDAHDVRLISDEIYHGITYPDDPEDPDARGVSARETSRSCVVVSSFSKYWGMTGWRIGWALVPPDLRSAVDALAGNIALCPPAPAALAATAAFTPASYAAADARVATFARTRTTLLDAVPGLGWGPIAPADGAFYLYADLADTLGRHSDASSWSRALLEEAGVAVVPGIDFDPIGGGRYVRLSFAAGHDAVTEAVERISAFHAG